MPTYVKYGRGVSVGAQGSVATQLRCGGMFGNHAIANSPQNMLVKDF